MAMENKMEMVRCSPEEVERRLEAARTFRPFKTERQLLEDSEQIVLALMAMARFRVTVPPEGYLDAFSKELAKEHLPGVLESIQTIARTPRGEGETALPDLGTILKNRPIRCTQ